ncbi:MAG: hypothetical protein RBR45_15555 [Pseudomonas sp.]|nr:hypothetical protein [Pseudomonas sp.]
MTDKEKEMLNMIEFLLEYVRRVAQKQVVYQDCVPLAKIRTFVKELKSEKPI